MPQDLSQWLGDTPVPWGVAWASTCTGTTIQAEPHGWEGANCGWEGAHGGWEGANCSGEGGHGGWEGAHDGWEVAHRPLCWPCPLQSLPHGASLGHMVLSLRFEPLCC